MRIRKSIRTKIALWVLVFFIAAGLSVIIVEIVFMVNVIDSFSKKFGAESALHAKNRIINVIRYHLNHCLRVSESVVIKDWFTDEDNLQKRLAAMHEWDVFQKYSPNTDIFAVIDSSKRYYFNKVYIYTLEPNAPESVWYYEKTMNSEQFNLNIDYNHALGMTKLWINVPVRHNNRFIGAIGQGIDLSQFVSNTVNQVEEGMTAVLFDTNGLIKACRQTANIDSNTVFQFYKMEQSQEIRAIMKRLRETDNEQSYGQFFFTRENRLLLGTITYMREIDWYALFTLDLFMMTQLNNYIPITVILILFCFVFLFMAIFSLVERVIIQPFMRMSDSMKSIAGGALDHRLEKEESLELGELSQNINKMVYSLNSSIQNLKNKEAEIAQYNEKLEEMVENRSSELATAYATIKQDLKLAQGIQQSLLYVGVSSTDKLDLYIKYFPIAEVGGDFYDITEINDGVIRIFIADAAGHGIQAAIQTMAIKTEYVKLKMIISDPAELMEILNSQFYTMYQKLALFFTAALVDLDLTRHTVTFCSAGHPPQYILKPDRLIKLKSGGKPIGAFEGASYRIEKMAFTDSDKILLFTDGVTEEFNLAGEEFGEAGLERVVKEYLQEGITKIVQKLMLEVYDYVGEGNLNDDITIIGIDIKNRGKL